MTLTPSPSSRLLDLSYDVAGEDVLIGADHLEALEVPVDLARSVSGRPGIDAGGLRACRQLEPWTAVLIGINKNYRTYCGIAVRNVDTTKAPRVAATPAAARLTMPPEVVACIPAKALSHAKSRLGLADAERRLVAKRLLHTTARTALGSDWVRSVLVVTADLELADIATAAGARVVPETAPGGLNAAVDLVRQAARFASPHGWVLTLVADLPYLTSAELDVLVVEALTAKRPVMVPDAQGVGTTCLLHPSDRPGPALFGPGSAHRHREAGYIPAGLSLVGLREDLDAAEDVMRLPERTRDALLTAEKSPDAERCRSVGGLALS